MYFVRECKGKRTLDMIVVGLVAIPCLPILIIVGLLVFLLDGRPVFFAQYRSGLDAKYFRLYKFRTMTDRRDENGRLLPDAERITAVGRFLRSLSLDELPQLYNVFKGEMSIVGPRPLLADYLSLYSQEQARRHCLKPGITGWAQVNGRNAIGWERKFELDVWYLDNWSLSLDIRILAITLPRVLMCSDISAAGHATAPGFTGDNQGADHDRAA
jgi:lipopolysaccharide/colanic/teichoic acid biosynthesis glycosyltransferase